jgi:hypothetical protein
VFMRIDRPLIGVLRKIGGEGQKKCWPPTNTDERGSGRDAVRDPAMQRARTRIFDACKANKEFFLNTFGPTDVIDMIKEGVMIGPASRETAEVGRKYTKREMPW